MNQDANEVLRQAVIMASSLLPPWVMAPVCTTTIPKFQVLALWRDVLTCAC